MSADPGAQRWQQVKALLAEALALDGAARAAFVEQHCGNDAALRDELLSLLEASVHGGAALDQPPTALALQAVQARAGAAWIGRRLGPWRITALIARGGMGEVYQARRDDGQFEQEVALKLMRANLDHESAALRFKAERQILASLDHPNLAKVLDGGVTDEGLPYFVMELVAGEPIDTYCERLQLSVPQRLRLFRSVCQVVHYAHLKGVVHRDLKAANILVTGQGVVKLVDFGIAKRVAPEDPACDPTATAQRVMTLAYSSPEQVRGGDTTPASDIYSLGVVLYRLLTAASPYPAASADSAYELTRAICDTLPLPPSQAGTAPALRRQLRGDLDAVVMMALRKEPAHRYASAEHFADDLFRHLERLPVQARRGAWSYRASRFVLRHRAVFAAALLANIALAAGLGLAAYEAYEANLQRARAERHFNSVRQLAKVFIFDVHDAINALPGATAARKLLVQNALTYLQQLSSEASGEAQLQLDIAKGYRRIGDIQGLTTAASLGDPAGALDAFQRAQALLTPLAHAPDRGAPGRQEARQELVLVQLRQGGLLQALSRLKEAGEVLERAAALAAELVAADPQHRHQLLLVSTLGQQSQVSLLSADIARYIAASDREARLLEGILARTPDDLVAGFNLALNRQTRAEHLLQAVGLRDGAAQALPFFREALARLQHLHDKHRNHTTVARHVAVARLGFGRALQRSGEPRQAVLEQRQAVEQLRALAERDGADVAFKADLAMARAQLSASLLDLPEPAAAAAQAEAALAIFGALPGSTLATTLMRENLALAHFHRGRALQLRGASREAACGHLHQSLQMLRSLAAELGPEGESLPTEAVQLALRSCPGKA